MTTIMITTMIATRVIQITQLKELLQNADDAQATEVNFVWDWRKFGTQVYLSIYLSIYIYIYTHT